MSPLRLNGGFSTSATGFDGRPHTFLARAKMPCSNTIAFVRVLADRAMEPIQRSIIGVVTASSWSSPNAGSNIERTMTS
ncbi:MAG TPA: hypothetical protein VMA77_32440 [Solirubrobacteraceae bacterium]|nr:hypothetical protein [Solirubrobacteraceae bacterium]